MIEVWLPQVQLLSNIYSYMCACTKCVHYIISRLDINFGCHMCNFFSLLLLMTYEVQV